MDGLANVPEVLVEAPGPAALDNLPAGAVSFGLQDLLPDGLEQEGENVERKTLKRRLSSSQFPWCKTSNFFDNKVLILNFKTSLFS